MFAKLLVILMVGAVIEAVYHRNWNGVLYWAGAVILNLAVIKSSLGA